MLSSDTTTIASDTSRAALRGAQTRKLEIRRVYSMSMIVTASDLPPRSEEYCKERWDFTRQRSQQLIDASVVVEELSTRVDTVLPNNEVQARQLAPVEDPEVRQEIWDRVLETDGENASAKAVKQAGDAVRGNMPEPFGLSNAREGVRLW
jgi:hypothetical protein